MAVSTKIIKRRIKSIASTKKITKAMELVAASKMRKAQLATTKTRPYSNKAWSFITTLSKKTDRSLHPLLLAKEKVKNICLVLVTSDRGLCGGFNSQIIKKAAEFYKKKADEGVNVEFFTVGKKGREFVARNKMKLVADFTNLGSVTTMPEVRAIAKMILDDFIKNKYDEVYLIYTDFVSTITQKPKIKKILPIDETKDYDLGVVSKEKEIEEKEQNFEFIFEPSTEQVLEYLLPKMVEVQIYQAILESNASEHSARMVAMKNASDSAKDMINDLTLTFNQARQSAITREIAEVVGGKAALE